MNVARASGLTVLRCGTEPTAVVDALRSALAGHDLITCSDQDLLRHIPAAEVVIPARSRISAHVLDAALRCRLIQQMGSGLDMVDMRAARKHNIAVANTPSELSGSAQSVAEMALFLTLALLRRHRALEQSVRAGQWQQVPIGDTLAGRTIGIVGMGGIGSALARMLRGFDCRLMGVTPHPDAHGADQLGLTWLGSLDDLPTMLANSNVVVLAIPLTDQTRSIIGSAEFAAMMPGTYLVNVSRAALVDRAALELALLGSKLAGQPSTCSGVSRHRPTTPCCDITCCLRHTRAAIPRS